MEESTWESPAEVVEASAAAVEESTDVVEDAIVEDNPRESSQPVPREEDGAAGGGASESSDAPTPKGSSTGGAAPSAEPLVTGPFTKDPFAGPRKGGPKRGASSSQLKATDALAEEVAQLEGQVKEQEARVAEWRRGSAAQQPQALVNEARARRDAVRKELHKAQARLNLITAERKAASKKLEKMSERHHSSRAANPELPSVALRGGGDEAITDEVRLGGDPPPIPVPSSSFPPHPIPPQPDPAPSRPPPQIRQMVKENKELEDAVTQHQDTKLHLEKLQNEKKDLVRISESNAADPTSRALPWRIPDLDAASGWSPSW